MYNEILIERYIHTKIEREILEKETQRERHGEIETQTERERERERDRKI